MKKYRILISLAIFAIALTTGQWSQAPRQARTGTIAIQPTPNDGMFSVTNVIDGDTIELDTGQKVRYIGVNTPETVDPHRAAQCFGHEASDYNRALVQGHRVRLEQDKSDTDQFGRLLRYIYLEDGTFVNLKLVQEGYAYAIAYPPDTAQRMVLDEAQHQAQAVKAGLWSACPTQLKHDK